MSKWWGIDEIVAKQKKPVAIVGEKNRETERKLNEFQPPRGYKKVAGPDSAEIMKGLAADPDDVNFIILQKV